MAGKLCVSVIEARNVQADDYAEKNFYVKLRVGSNEVKTDVVKGSLQPKFLKDCRLAVPTPETDTLRIELLQVGPRGDLVVGSDDLRVLTITARGTIVHWFQLKTASRAVNAELCLVLRFLSAGSNRPMSPTYAITARQAKERALEGPSTPQAPSKMAFRDLEPASAAASPTASTSTSRYGLTSPSTVSTPGPAYTERPTTASAAAGYATANGVGSTGTPSASSAHAHSTARTPAAQAGQGSGRRPGRLRAAQVPLPLAVLGGIVVGALVYIWKKRPVYYEVQEDDTLCHIASCFKKRVEEVYAKNRTLLKNPNRLYPGDRLRIR
ncbi:hypothetical protein GPECTOR_19g305 [Gonium pectorale]|uniref:LysM domain-containing protein n=1 Tax=Gonium pectorale TaxID=33097 RepID=A0A150GJB5_GONPE|nr:hypothetical protein GPECTOR_19g305 [Gonium pectorale]|eukprot:KXZ49854.1 hypothetical protein GPECTOR_19g305 [Gonium pectorale]